MKVRVTIDGGARLQAGLRRSAADMRAPRDALREAGEEVARTASRLAAKRSGRMSRSNRVKVLTTVARISNRTRYAPYQEHGTGPIFARRAPMLHFQINGQWISTYSTRGVPAVHYLARAAEAP